MTAINPKRKCRHCGAPWEYDWEYCPECHRNYGGAEYPAKQTEEELRDVAERPRQIHEAFATVSRGGGMTLHQSHLEGTSDPDDDTGVWRAAGEKDPESHWSEVPGWKLETGSSTFSFLDAEGWRFYLPAFLCWSLENWRTSDSTTADAVVWNLALSDEFWAKRYEWLDRAQCEAVYDFLAFFDKYSGEADAGEAIQAYWHRFKRD